MHILEVIPADQIPLEKFQKALFHLFLFLISDQKGNSKRRKNDKSRYSFRGAENEPETLRKKIFRQKLNFISFFNKSKGPRCFKGS